MKALPGIALAVAVTSAAWGGGITDVTVDSTEYTNISEVHISGNGRIFISAANGMTTVSPDELPDDFLKSWNINKDSAAAVSKNKSKAALENAIANGSFREVDGVVYDIRNPESGWIHFPEAKIIQVLDDGVIADITPENDDYFPIHIKNLPNSVGDTDTISITAKLVGNYSFVNKLGDDRTIREYDVGRVCPRDEIPESVLSGQKAFDVSFQQDVPAKDVLASLPEGSDIQSSGSGFFITEDGYLVTNFHVVKDSKNVKVKTGADVYPAEVVHVDKDNDLALLKVSGKFKPLCLSTNDAQLGEGVFTIGFPDIVVQGTEPKYTDGKISSLAGIQDDPKEYQISVPVQPGNSGGPLVDMNGNVVGIVVAKLNDIAVLAASGDLPQNVNYAIKGKYINDFLAQFPEIKLNAASAISSSSVVQSTQQSVAIVLVY
jgi:S1-C subfamily serine protease